MTIKKKVLNVIAEYPLRDDKETTLVKIEFDKNTLLRDVFKRIDSEMQIYLLSDYYEGYALEQSTDLCPYIFAKGTIYWNVPYEEIKVEDFLKTHKISNNTITVKVDCLACDGGLILDWVLQSWAYIIIVLDYLGYALEISQVLQMLFNTFGKKKKKIPSFNSIEQYLLSEECWDLKVLIRETRIPKKILVPLLNGIGFEEHEGKFYKNAWEVTKYNRAKEEIEYENYISNYDDLKKIDYQEQDTINTSLITLCELSSAVDNKETYNEVLLNLVNMLEKKEKCCCYDEEIELIIDAIKRLEDKIGIE